jgi:2-polyprenyl-3-methyl-5-hydroxy-6-metoxy-1,4-benzoquinol methylase
MATSLRDPSGSVLVVDERIIRIIHAKGLPDLNAFLNSSASQSFLNANQIVGTNFLDSGERAHVLENAEARNVFTQSAGATIVEHERVPFQSFPYEWPAEMLHAAATLTLDMADQLLDEGLGLKDASPYNVLYRGPRPVFIDLLSFEQRDPHDPTWLPFAQFVRTFLLPLLVNKYFHIGLDQILTTHRDGIEPEEVTRLCGPIQKLRSPFLTLATIPARLAARHSVDDTTIYQPKPLNDPVKARFILQRVLKSVRRKLAQVAPRSGRNSAWSNYTDHNNYTADYLPVKQAFVEQALAYCRPKKVLDVGCNTGQFSALAAGSGASVVAIDYDPVVVGDLWRRAIAEDLDILPLVVNLARPTPGTGWRNQECAPFLERANSNFDGVFLLAVIHHLLVSERIPLAEIVDLAADLTTDMLVIEYIAPGDPMFRRISRGRDHLFEDLNRDVFETTCRRRFDITRSEQLGDTQRWLYLMEKKGVAPDA